MKYILRKLGYIAGSLFIVLTLTFFLMKAIPGDPFSDEQALPKETHQALLRYYKLDQPLWKQYIYYLGSIFKGDFGPSFKYPDRSVNAIIKQGFPTSALLGLESLTIALALGLTFGVIAACKARKWQDLTILVGTTLAVSIPSFILAAFLQFGLALKLELFPLARWGTFMQTVLPAIALAALPAAFITRLVRSNLLEVFQCDYIKTAVAKGLSPKKILLSHALPNAILPILSYIGQIMGNILVGSFVIENIFSIPGLGQWFVNSVSNRDYSVIMGLTIFYSLLLLIIIFLIDILYSWIDPRIKMGARR